ncbi:PepSY domain-containing protein [Roseovarius aestuarii]|uniref:PepSY domain-containing protein n=1 Tax=Roseovarius aestuarii TaxID=475083 RepID=A0A1X7BW26_9RHOB|nr:PepSY domain-containing protein [Roseovarius aestuarii]SMC13838.1 hypothetical protein ROA7745_03698 [Roseovarius aestuarii]
MIKYAKPALLAGLLIPGIAFAQINKGDALGSSEAAILSALEAQGYTITGIETEGGEIEVDAMLDGTAYEIEVSAETGMVIEIELGDDDGSDDS